MQPRAETRREGRHSFAGFNVLLLPCRLPCLLFDLLLPIAPLSFFFARKAAVERDASEVSQKQHTVHAAAARACSNNPVPWTRPQHCSTCRLRGFMQGLLTQFEHMHASKQASGARGDWNPKERGSEKSGQISLHHRFTVLCARTPSQIKVSNSNHTAGSEYVAKSIYMCVRMASPLVLYINMWKRLVD